MAFTLRHLGELVKSHRESKGLTQDELAKKLGPSINRSLIAHLEQGLRMPSTENLTSICSFIELPPRYWQFFTRRDGEILAAFEECLSELTGEVVNLAHLDEASEQVARKNVLDFFAAVLTQQQAFDWLNSLLIYYNIRPLIKFEFFQTYLGKDSFKSPDSLRRQIYRYQMDAIVLFNNFATAYRILNSEASFQDMLLPLKTRSDESYRLRTDWEDIEVIENSKLGHLGYISAAQYKQEKTERQLFSDFLSDLAKKIEESGTIAVDSIPQKQKRKMDAYWKKFHSTLPHGFLSPLFVPDPRQLRREADLLAPKNDDIVAEMAKTQEMGLRNLAKYLAADYLDIYVATSMRDDSDFISANTFISQLFTHTDVRPLRLRFFNPTMSWIEDRVAKGLVEALMLKRASFTIYMAQKSDSFGKDSEASVALGQGKPVIVYVPKLLVSELNIDSEKLSALPREELAQIINSVGAADDVDEAVDERGLRNKIIEIRLGQADQRLLTEIAKRHWADFGLYGEVERIKDKDEKKESELREQFRNWLDTIKNENASELPLELKSHLVKMLVAVADGLERRASIFRETHPLALQVVLTSGILNGMIVSRSVNSCATILRKLVTNQLELELQSDENNYRLIEKSTKSIIRVISRHALISSAFSTFYEQSTTASRNSIIV